MGLLENVRKDPVIRLEIRDALTVTPETTVRQVVILMREANLGCAIVIDNDRKPTGIFTESMLVELLSHGAARLDEAVEKHLARSPWVGVDNPVADVLEAMQLKNIRLLCVVDGDGRVVGVTGQRGLMEYVAEHFPNKVMVQRVGQLPYLTNREGA